MEKNDQLNKEITENTSQDIKIIEFTIQEIFVTRQMLEIALKSIGREAVIAFTIIDKKLESALK